MPAKILVVDDNADAREILTLLLEKQGFTVITAPDGQEALKLVKAETFDLIITDLQMPNLDGIGLIKALRTRPELSSVPILVMSAFPGRSVTDALAAGANGSASKPVDFDLLIKVIQQLLLLAILVFHNSLAFPSALI